MSIKVSNIVKVYGTQQALDDVSFEVGGGEIIGFLGPNGAGKSTMMKIITCFIPQTKGKVTVCGYDVEEDSIEVRRNVGYLPENNPLYYDMYVKEYLEFIAGIYGIGKETGKRVKEMIEITGLGVEQHKLIGALSKGYKQRVGLAQAMIHNPKVLVLDEPTSGLDPNQLVGIRALIKELGKEKTVMLSTHIMQEVEALCDRVIIINKGKIVANSASSELNSRNKNKQLVSVEFNGITTAELLSTIEGVAFVKKLTPQTWHIEASMEEDIRPAIFKFAVENGLAVLAMQKEEQSMEEIFQQLTK